MNEEYKKIKRILSDLRSEYANLCSNDVKDPNTPITERDIVAEIYYRLKLFCEKKTLYPHTDLKHASSRSLSTTIFALGLTVILI